jgi:type II secretory pathway component PulK
MKNSSFTSQRLKSKQGIALMLVLVALVFLSIISFEFMYASRIDLKISSNARNRLQAWYLAQSGAKFALLRLFLYQKLLELKQNASSFPLEEKYLDQIWSFALPSFPFLGQVFGKDHRLPGEITSLIQSEGSLIPINLLDANRNRKSSKEKAKQVLEDCKKLFESALEDEEFDKLYRGMRFEDIFNPLVDWIDSNNEKVEGGDENSDYEKKDPSYLPRNDRIPVISELNMVLNWNDDLVKRFGKEFSVLKSDMKINPNYIPLSRLKVIHNELTNEDLKVIDEHRREEPFKDLNELQSFIQNSSEIRGGQGFTFPKSYTTSLTESIFHIEASGRVGQAQRKIRLGIKLLEIPEKNKNKAPTPNTSASSDEKSQDKTQKEKPQKYGPPEVVSIEVLL